MNSIQKIKGLTSLPVQIVERLLSIFQHSTNDDPSVLKKFEEGNASLVTLDKQGAALAAEMENYMTTWENRVRSQERADGENKERTAESKHLKDIESNFKHL